MAGKSKAEQFTHDDLSKIWHEIQEQPSWRVQANREMDYKDGNQLDSAILNELALKGIPPSIENAIGPVVDDLTGMEAKNRTDWRVQPDADKDPESEQVAEALNFKLNQAERRSGADRSCSDAYEPQIGVGLGWVEVSREGDAFKYPYRCRAVHRNEIWWDFLAKEPDLSDARWLLRRRWTDVDIVKMMFPKHKDLIEQSGTGWGSFDQLNLTSDDADAMENLYQSQDIERGWSVEEQEWRTPGSRRICIFEILERRWEPMTVIKTPDGRIVEFDKSNSAHQMAAIAFGNGIPGYVIKQITGTKIYKHFFFGPHRLQSEQSEFNTFNYVPFWGKREDRTNVPYGIIRWLMYLQDEINARISKMQWLLSATRTERTDGAVKMTDEVFRQEVGRPDADIKLDHEHMALSGARFEVKHNEQLNQQQFQRLLDLRTVVKTISSVSAALSGEEEATNAGAMSQAIEQSIQGLAKINDNFAFGRKQVGDLLLTMIVKDMEGQQEQVFIPGAPIKEDKQIILNAPVEDEQSGQRYLTNDVARTKLQVTLEEVPSTPSFRQQQLSALSEAFKSAPPQYQAVMMPHLMHLANVPNKDDIIAAIMKINEQANLTEEQVEERVKEAIEQAKTKWMVEQKDRELAIKERESSAKIEQIEVKNVLDRIEAKYSAIQAAIQAILNPGAAPAADQFLKSSGDEDQDAAPLLAEPGQAQINTEALPDKNTSPMFSPKVQEPDVEELREPLAEPMQEADEGMNHGIEAGV